MAQETVFLTTDDIVSLKSDNFIIGIVERSFGDVDGHEPGPQRDYDDRIQRHKDVPKAQFKTFMKSGIPPRGTVLVSWQNEAKTELIPERCLTLMDRALYLGDVVKKHAQDPMSGTVTSCCHASTLLPCNQVIQSPTTPSVSALLDEFALRRVSSTSIVNVHEYSEGSMVIYGDWVGRIEEVYDEIAVKLSNNSVVIVEDAAQLESEDNSMDRLGVGDFVKTKKGNLRRGRWRYGVYDPNIRPEGMVVETRTIELDVQWMSRKFGEANNLAPEPLPRLTLDDLESPNFHHFGDERLPKTSKSADPIADLPSHLVTNVRVGDRVRFRDLQQAEERYDGTKVFHNGRQQMGKLRRIPRTETLGYDLNVFVVMQTHTRVQVQWQDCSVTSHWATELIPDPNVGDDDEVWPGELIVTKEAAADNPDGAWSFKPARVGVVQSVKSRDRIAAVRWFEQPNILFMGEDLIPPSETGKLSEVVEDISLYDIESRPGLTRRRGDWVMVHPGVDLEIDGEGAVLDGSQPQWFGEVIDLCLDGRVLVRLGTNEKNTVDVRVPTERVTLVYSDGEDDHMDIAPHFDGDSVDEDEMEDLSDFDSQSFNEMWVEYEGMDGEPGTVDEEEWSTEDEDEDDDDDEDDASMPDLVDVDTSKTTPVSQSDGDRKESLQAPPATSLQPPPLMHQSSSDPMCVDPPVRPIQTVVSPFEDELVSDPNAPEAFMVLDGLPPRDHAYGQSNPNLTPSFMRRVAKEHKILRDSLPPGIFVRTWEARLDLLRVLIIGPSDTPYEFAPFIIDFHLGHSYPLNAPSAYFHSWTDGKGSVNPNLYEDGKICLSLLGTWHTDERNESWSATKSTLLQVLVSLMGLVLVKEPYYNEAGYDPLRSSPETKLASSLYTERTYFRSRGFIVHALENEVLPFKEELQYLYLSNAPGAPRLLDKALAAANDVLERSSVGRDGERDGLRTISLGAVVMLKRQAEKLVALRAKADAATLVSS